MQMSRLAAPFALAAAALAGCTSTPVAETPAKPVAVSSSTPPPMPAAAGTTSAPKPVASSTITTVTLAPHLDPRSAIASERSVYFDFDVFAVKDDYASLIERQGKYLASKPALAVRIEGNSDERGSSEYNLALGQKRAQAVLQALKVYGVRDSQMEPVSWGKERPKSAGHDESAWAQNRRADVVYPKQ